MSLPYCSRRGWARAYRMSVYACVLAVVLLLLVVPNAFSQGTHGSNPYVGATVYASPDYTTEVGTAVATEPAGSALANQMTVVGKTPTFVWLDRIAAIAGGSVNSGRLGLQGHINAAVAQANGAPIVVQLVIYDLPDRDCAALASNGELSIAGGDTPRGYTTPLTGTGIQEYENDYITPIYNILAAAPSNVRFVLVIEDDSLPNIVTNTGYSYALANCIAANGGESYPTYSMSSVYVQGIQYALNKFHSLPNAYNYLDIGHHGWLGWTEGASLAFPFYADVAKGTTDGFASIDGIITNTANYGPTKEPYMTAMEEIGGNAVESATFYSYDPEIDELDYAEEFYAGLTGVGFPSTLGFLIDTSRNGWGGPIRPTGPSTSTVLNTFVDATKIDQRDDMGQWCNQANQGIGSFPTVNPGGFSNLQAYVWVKPPGESDGNYPGSVYNGITSTDGDPNCNPTNTNALANGMVINSIPNSPPAGTFWLTEFLEDVKNAYPPISTTVGPGYSISASAVSLEQGATATGSVTVSVTGGFSSAIELSVTGLPAGVTASFSPASVTGSEGSTITFTASATAVPGTYSLTVTGTSGTTNETATLSLTVVAAPNFTITASPAAISVPVGTNPTDTITVTFVGGLTGSLSVSATGLPSGMQANFAPSSVNAPGGTIVANFSDQTSTPAGTYNVLIVGTDGTITHSATIVITVPGTGTFTLSPSAPTLSIQQSTSATDTITVSGAAGSVTLAASGLPSGVTALFGTNPTTGISLLTFTASSTATVGTSTVTITATSGTHTATTGIVLTITSSGSCAPTTITPYLQVNGAAWQQTNTASVPAAATVNLGPQPISGTWNWTGPSGFTSATRQMNAIPLSAGINTYVATYTNASSCKSTETFTITEAGGSSPSFTLAPSAGSVSVKQGNTATDTIAVTDLNGFTGSVSLADSGLPSSVTATFGTNPTAGSSVITFAASAAAPAGTYTITVTGTSGTLKASTTITLTVASSGTGGACLIDYVISPQNTSAFGATITMNNTGSTALSSWTLTWTFPNGQTIASLWNGDAAQSGANVTVTNESYNGSIPTGGSYSGVGFNGTWNGVTNSVPTSISLNGVACTVN
jgi:cellulose 1,4-beta-cellobiosidase